MLILESGIRFHTTKFQRDKVKGRSPTLCVRAAGGARVLVLLACAMHSCRRAFHGQTRYVMSTCGVLLHEATEFSDHFS